jgi:hypothetical protein
MSSGTACGAMPREQTLRLIPSTPTAPARSGSPPSPAPASSATPSPMASMTSPSTLRRDRSASAARWSRTGLRNRQAVFRRSRRPGGPLGRFALFRVASGVFSKTDAFESCRARTARTVGRKSLRPAPARLALRGLPTAKPPSGLSAFPVSGAGRSRQPDVFLCL